MAAMSSADATALEPGRQVLSRSLGVIATQLDDLGDTRPLVLWLRGTADLRLTCVNSVSIVGSRAATGYGSHVAIEMAASLA